MHYDTLIVSDIHLGTPVSKTDKLLKVLNETSFDRLIINGDLFDCHNLKRFKKSHWKVLSTLRKLTQSHTVVFVGGNHDGDVETISLILGLKFVLEYKWEVNGKKFIAVHGHKNDKWTSKFPRITDFFTGIYYLIQLIDKKHIVCGFLKHKSKVLLGVHKTMRRQAFEVAARHKVDGIFVGHSHIADDAVENGVRYINSGSFCELPCHYILVDKNGNAGLKEI